MTYLQTPFKPSLEQPLILGSQSPRRVQVFNYFNIPFLQVPSHYEEETHPFKGDGGLYVQELAEAKALAIQQKFFDRVIVTADTACYIQGQMLNKPAHLEESRQMLRKLSGNWHSVYTGVCVLAGDQHYAAYEETKLLFNSLSEEEIESYIQSTYTLDKAGACDIQGFGALLVNRIEGSYDNIMGLPINLLKKLLFKVGLNLWDYLPPLKPQ